MRKQLTLTFIVLSTCLVLGSATFSAAYTPIPEESGVTGFINLGAAYFNVENNMIAGNDFGDTTEKKIDSIHDSPESNSDGKPIINAELAYTFAGTRTQLTAGNTLEDFLQFDLTTQLGVRQELPDKSVVSLAYVFSAIPTKVWEDPYVEDTDREDTYRRSNGVRLGYSRILGTKFKVEGTWRKIDIGTEKSGETQLGLAGSDADRLDRNGNQYNLKLMYLFSFLEGKHTLIPTLGYTRHDLDGSAMARDQYSIQLAHKYTGEIFDFVTNLYYAYADYDKSNPIYDKTREDNLYGAAFSAFYKGLFGVEKLSLVGTVGAYKGDSNIDFYDAAISTVGLSVMYNF